MLIYCIVRYTALDVWCCDLCYMFHALTICLGGRRETTSGQRRSLLLIDASSDSYILMGVKFGRCRCGLKCA